MLRRTIDQFLWSMDTTLLLTRLRFYAAYDRVHEEAVALTVTSGGIGGPLDARVLPSVASICTVIRTNGFADRDPFSRKRGLPTGAPEALILFLALVLWW